MTLRRNANESRRCGANELPTSPTIMRVAVLLVLAGLANETFSKKRQTIPEPEPDKALISAKE